MRWNTADLLNPSSEVTQHHFYHIILVKRSHETKEEIRSISWCDEWQEKFEIIFNSLQPPKFENGAITATEAQYHLVQSTQCLMLTVLMFALKLPSPIAAKTNRNFIHSPQQQPPQASGLPKGSGPGCYVALHQVCRINIVLSWESALSSAPGHCPGPDLATSFLTPFGISSNSESHAIDSHRSPTLSSRNDWVVACAASKLELLTYRGRGRSVTWNYTKM